MVGIVVVSHSRPLAEQAVRLAADMVPPEVRPRVAVAAGLDADTFGTDAAAIAEAVAEVDDGAGVLVLMDLGSAVLSSEMALDFLDPDLAGRVRLTPAPLVEGLVAAVVTASSGGDLDSVDREARRGLAGKAEHLSAEAPEQAGAPEQVGAAEELGIVPVPATQATGGPVREFRWRVSNLHGLHARPAAALVAGLAGLDVSVDLHDASTGRGPVDAHSVTRVASLGLRRGHELVARCQGPDAEQAVARLTELAATQFGDSLPPGTLLAATLTAGELLEDHPDNPPARPATEAAEPVLPDSSTGTGLEVVLGPALLHDAEVDTSGYRAGSDEPQRVRTALAHVAEDLLLRARGPHGDIFAAQHALLTDPEVLDSILTRLRSPLLAAAAPGRQGAPEAVRTTFAALAASQEQVDDPYLRERAQDLRSLGRQVLRALVGDVSTSARVEQEPHVLVVAELDAATAAGLDAVLCRGVVTTSGGTSGHGVIVATGRGIPVLTGHPEAATLDDGDLVGFDPRSGRLWLRPDAAQADRIVLLARDREQEQQRVARQSHEPASTRDGRRVLVEANVGSLADAARAAAAGAEGAGLVRTELLWGHLPVPPSTARQVSDLVALGDALGGQVLTIRTWDAGGDKPLPFLVQPAELNPFLGERGLRTMRRAPELFVDQLRAVVLAGQQTPVRVMFPMVTEPEELLWARGLLDEVVADLAARPVPVGIMVEVPSAALRITEFARLVDFVSIGTNDLTQYTCAADRGNALVSHLGRQDSPAVAALIARTCQGLPGIPVGVCGDLASDPDRTAMLVELGVSELSVRPPLVGLVKAAVRAVDEGRRR